MNAREDWVEKARGVSIAEASSMLGLKLPKRGELQTACPACGGQDRFSVSPAKGVWNCRGSEGGNDAIGLVMHAHSVDFMGACEFLTGEPAPGREAGIAAPNPDADRERRDERRAAAIERMSEEEKARRDAIIAATRMFEKGEPFGDSYAEAYMERRGIRLRPDQTVNLRFVPTLTYWGYADPDADEPTDFGPYPAMMAAIRNAAMEITGVHFTYLDRDRPRKMKPPGNDRRRNNAKKIRGNVSGGVIWLGAPAETICMGEGIETSSSYPAIPDLPASIPPDIGIACGVALGNIAGSSTDTVPHPLKKGRTVNNGVPDLEKPGIILPDVVKRVILLGDGDSDQPETKAKLLCGMRRFQAQGKEVEVHMAAEGSDWNVVLMEMLKGAAS